MSIAEVGVLIAGAGAHDGELERVVGRIGLERVVSILVAELVDRADVDELNDGATGEVQFELRFGDEVARHLVRIERPQAVAHEAGLADNPLVTIFQDATDLVRAVFGPRAVRTNSTRYVVWGKRDNQLVHDFPHLSRLVYRLLRGAQNEPVDLTELVVRHGSDKWGPHYYTQHYQRYFEAMRDRALTVLELGVGGYEDPAAGGGSLRAWARYFHRGLIYGVDLEDKKLLRVQRVETMQGDQSDRDFLGRLVERTGPLDIVIDDCSHIWADTIASFRFLFPHVRPGGLYVVEDVQTSYWAGWEGDGDRTTPVDFFKGLVDGLNHEEVEPIGARPPTETDQQIVGLHFYHNLIVIEKGTNREGTWRAPASRAACADHEMRESEVAQR